MAPCAFKRIGLGKAQRYGYASHLCLPAAVKLLLMGFGSINAHLAI